jgi:hydroxyethylthiazole kinase-like uncharacterized protein yjeF
MFSLTVAASGNGSWQVGRAINTGRRNMKVSRISEMRLMDRAAMETYGISDALLMENAGEAVYFAVLKECGIRNRRFVVFSGIGNNGGDGFVAARKIHSSGGWVKIFVVGDPSRYRGAAKLNYEIVSRLPIEVQVLTHDRIDEANDVVSGCDTIIDALFGTGLTRDVEGLHARVVGIMNGSGKTVFSVDIPSGVHGGTGRIMGAAVKADCTVTFGLPKIGNLLYPGYERCGKLYVTHISFPPVLYDRESIRIEINDPAPLPSENEAVRKDEFRTILLVMGPSSRPESFSSAVVAFVRAGAGRPRVAMPESIASSVAEDVGEITAAPQKETVSGNISLENKEPLLELCRHMDMIVLGPGLSSDEETCRLVRELVPEIRCPILIGGDAVAAVSGDFNALKSRREPTILAVEPGGISGIMETGSGDSEDTVIDVLRRRTDELDSIIVLEDAHSLIGFPDGNVLVNMSGSPGITSADRRGALAGTVAAMYGSGLSLGDAVGAGVFVYGCACDLAVGDAGGEGVPVENVIEHLPAAVRGYRKGLSDEQRQGVEVV